MIGTFIAGLVCGLIIAGIFAYNYKMKFDDLLEKSASKIKEFK